MTRSEKILMCFIGLYSIVIGFQSHQNEMLISSNKIINQKVADLRKSKTQDSLFHIMLKEAVINQEKEREEAEQEIIDNYTTQ